MSEDLYARIAELEAQLAAVAGPAYVPQSYPKMVYSGNGTLTVANEAEYDAAKADGYSDEPLSGTPTSFPHVYQHAKYPARLIHSAAEAAELGDGWTAA